MKEKREEKKNNYVGNPCRLDRQETPVAYRDRLPSPRWQASGPVPDGTSGKIDSIKRCAVVVLAVVVEHKLAEN